MKLINFNRPIPKNTYGLEISQKSFGEIEITPKESLILTYETYTEYYPDIVLEVGETLTQHNGKFFKFTKGEMLEISPCSDEVLLSKRFNSYDADYDFERYNWPHNIRYDLYYGPVPMAESRTLSIGTEGGSYIEYWNISSNTLDGRILGACPTPKNKLPPLISEGLEGEEWLVIFTKTNKIIEKASDYRCNPEYYRSKKPIYN